MSGNVTMKTHYDTLGLTTRKPVIEVLSADPEIWISQEVIDTADPTLLTLDSDDRVTIHAINGEFVYQLDRTVAYGSRITDNIFARLVAWWPEPGEFGIGEPE